MEADTPALLRPMRNVRSTAGFTLLEVLVASTVLVLLVAILFQMTAGVGSIWKSSSGKVSAFQSARSAFSTLSETLSRATLNTYVDYATTDSNNRLSFRNPNTAASFVPKQFARASELHFLCGPTADLANAAQGGTGASATTNPGDAVFFQAPLNNTLQNATYAGLSRMLNSVGFYLQYAKTDPTLLPTWLSSAASAQKYRYQLVQYVEPTESLQVYKSTSSASYSLDWLNFAFPSAPNNTGSAKTRVLAEDVVLLLLRPRLSPADETKVAAAAPIEPYDGATQLGSVLAPNYHYDSRAWQMGYPLSARVSANTNAAKRITLMTNQLPPIIDMVMVSVDAQTLARFDTTTATPPSALVVTPASLFTNSANMEADINTYADQLSAAHVRFHIERGTISIQGAKWSNN